MDKNKSQLYNYAHETIPVLFHSQTDDFFKYLERDGRKFLKFWWDHLGEMLPEMHQTAYEEFHFERVEMNGATRAAILKFPPPRAEGEAYFLGLVQEPERRFAWLKFPNTRIIALVRGKEEAQLGYLTPRALFVPIAEEVEPTLEAFKTVFERLTAKK